MSTEQPFATARFRYQLIVECPYCGTAVNLADSDDVKIPYAIFHDKMHTLVGYKIECPHDTCNATYEIEEIEEN